jgi:hypothetical protein
MAPSFVIVPCKLLYSFWGKRASLKEKGSQVLGLVGMGIGEGLCKSTVHIAYIVLLSCGTRAMRPFFLISSTICRVTILCVLLTFLTWLGLAFECVSNFRWEVEWNRVRHESFYSHFQVKESTTFVYLEEWWRYNCYMGDDLKILKLFYSVYKPYGNFCV